jgi:hypothetical protein
MQTFKKHPHTTLTLALCGALLFAANVARAESDMQIQERVLKARELTREQQTGHAAHVNPVDKNQEFHGVFYGFFPCSDCNGIKMTLSLKQNNNYLLVTQPARESSREFYEKGKYSWNDDTHTVVLTPRKQEAPPHQYFIKEQGTLIQLNEDGKPMTDDGYILRRSDTVKAREVHIH